MEVLAPNFIEDLYRLAVLQAGDRGAALSCVAEVLAEAEANAAQWRTQKHRFLWAARLLSQRLVRKVPAAAASGEEFSEAIQSIINALQSVRPEIRAGLALYCTGKVKSSEVLQLHRLRSRDWRVALVRFRDQMAYCSLPEERLHEIVKSLSLSPEDCLVLQQSVSKASPRRRGWDKILAVAAVLLGVCLFAGWFAWERWRESPAMRMRAHMAEFLELNQSAGIAGLENFEGTAGQTQDWLFLHGMEGVFMPELFRGVKVVAARMMKWNGASVAQFPTLDPPGLLIVAESESMGLPEEGAESGRSSFADWSAVWESAGSYKVLWMVQMAAGALDQQLRALSESSQGR
jgi:hypothetical protein